MGATASEDLQQRVTVTLAGLRPLFPILAVGAAKEVCRRLCVRTPLHRTGKIDALVDNAGQSLIGSSEETKYGNVLRCKMCFVSGRQGGAYAFSISCDSSTNVPILLLKG